MEIENFISENITPVSFSRMDIFHFMILDLNTQKKIQKQINVEIPLNLYEMYQLIN